MRPRFFFSLCAALALAAAASAPARAEGQRLDFDRAGVDVPKLVEQARESSQPKLEGGKTETEKAAAPEDSYERRIVVFKEGTSPGQRADLIQGLGGVVTKDLRLIDALAAVVPKARIEAFDARLKALSDVKRVEKDFVQNWLRAASREDPPPPEEQREPWGIERVNASAAWGVTQGDGVNLAVIDTGIDTDHPDLKVAGGVNCVEPGKPFKDDHGHGTHVAGTIAAQDNEQGVVGVAPEVSLYGVKVLDAYGSGTFADVISGIQWAVENGMDIANMSLGAGYGTDALEDAVKKAAAAGLTIVAAAGNSGGDVGYPAAYPETIAVAASDSKDKVAWFSSRGPEVDFIAPGVDVLSTAMDGGYAEMSGTSMASPHVAGLAALAAASQGLSGPEEIRAALRDAAAKFPGVPAEEQGAGMIDAGLLAGGCPGKGRCVARR
jgi:subtilisin family serine protease